MKSLSKRLTLILLAVFTLGLLATPAEARDKRKHRDRHKHERYERDDRRDKRDRHAKRDRREKWDRHDKRDRYARYDRDRSYRRHYHRARYDDYSYCAPRREYRRHCNDRYDDTGASLGLALLSILFAD